MLNWEWYKVQNTKDVFIHCLLKANWKEGKFQGKDIPRGSFVTSLETLSEELGLTIQQIRTALKHLISTNEITNKSFSKYRIITIVNYELYQENNKMFNNQLTNNQQSNNNQVTTIEEYKNNRIIDDIDNNSTTTGTMCVRESLFEFVEQEFGRTLSSSEYEVVSKWQNDEVTRYAIKQASLARATNVKYVERILNSYKKDNITSVTEAEERDRRYQEVKDKRQNYSRGKGESYIQRRLRELKEEENVKK